MLLSSCCLILSLCSAGATHDDNQILQQLLDPGVPVGSGAPLRLPAPTMADGLDAAAQKMAIKGIADANHPLDALLRKSVVSPFQLSIRSEGNAANETTGKRVDIFFIVYGDLQLITKEGWLEERFSFGAKEEAEGKPPAKSIVLAENDLKKRGLEVAASERFKEGYDFATFSVFDRVQLSGTGHVMQTQTAESVVVASLLSPKFADDAEFANRWAPIERNDSGVETVGKPQPYAGYGSYVKVTKLHEPAGALFIEYHLVFDEPKAWFGGANLLRSKLPLLVQDNIRKFRRELTKGP